MKKLISLFLALLFIPSVFVDCTLKEDGGKTDCSGFGISLAAYPKMAPYPDETASDFDEQYDAWRASKKLQLNQKDGYRDGLDPFFKASIKEFLSTTNGENRVYSPLNVFMALSMLAELTDGNSRAQILDLLGSESIEALREQASAVWNANYCDDGALTSVLANSIWLSKDIAFVQSTMDTLAEKYYASSFRGEMGSDEFNKALQNWLNEQTGGLLKDQAGKLTLDAETILALATTIYYKARWSDEFSEERNSEGIFHSENGDLKCTFMNRSSMDKYYYSDRFSAVAKPLEGSGYMYFILPDEGVSADDLLSDEKTYELFLPNGAGCDNKYVLVNLSVPKFDVASDISLTDGLKALGVTDVFDFEKSDFSPMTTDTDEIAVKKAEHAARVKIDEEGVTAAAFTVMAMCGSGMPEETVDFVLDRPFIFVITGADGMPLFTGVVNQPE